ncbi:hypothetical protein N7463_001219 [Penicillium fimorum]|uniref:Uncharacterized protein n=1 Tax=Penicillium fimorum TaxID=1882269 RepID=A0A9X0CBM5_9EURO|nr:hypothetical protein N7463_001219 [Penicillium fimorum]
MTPKESTRPAKSPAAAKGPKSSTKSAERAANAANALAESSFAHCDVRKHSCENNMVYPLLSNRSSMV